MIIYFNGQFVVVVVGEIVFNVFNVVGLCWFVCNDYGQVSGVFCGMGVCYCCLVVIDGWFKCCVCQIVVWLGMWVEIESNCFDQEEWL